MSDDESLVLVAVDEPGLAIVTLNRPEKRNALPLAMWPRLGAIFRELAARDDVRAVILTGAGGHFSAGADIAEFATARRDATQAAAYAAAGADTAQLLRDYPKPIIAAVSGYGVGGGFGLALTCDFRVGDRTTRMGIPAARLGIVYGTEACRALIHHVGLANAKRLLFSGKIFAAQDCLALGLLDQLAPDAAVDGARALAREFLESAPLSVRGAKRIADAVALGDDQRRAADLQALVDQAFNSEDYREGQRAFKEKRQPRFRGR